MTWARLLMQALGAAGVREVVVSPGSRSTPLVLAAAEHVGFRVHSVIDERAAAFFALGQARLTEMPTVLICTSGTAAAHYYPAIIEASLARVPLVVITADRPPELQASAAPQTIDQHRLYGAYVRSFHDLGLPNSAPVARAAVRRRAVQAVDEAVRPEPGPVHINVPLRKPLEPDPSDDRRTPEPPAPTVIRPRRRLEVDALDDVIRRLRAAERPVITIGPGPVPQGRLRTALVAVARRFDAAVYAEATSQLRFGANLAGDGLGVLLQAESFAARFDPDLIVQLGPPVTSSAWHRWRARRPDVPAICASAHDWPDPSQYADTWITASVHEVLSLIVDRALEPARSDRWRRQVAEWDQRAWSVVDGMLLPDSEGEAVRVVRDQLPAESYLMLGNSLAVRHFDSFCSSGGAPVNVLSQRGANGIDGLVAGAVGAASVAGRAVTLVLGDVSLAHDAGALALATQVGAPVVVVVLDNGGGRIFDLLPAGRRLGHQPVFDYFTTPPEVDVQTLAAAYRQCHVGIDGTTDLAPALTTAYRMGAATVVQVKLPDHGARMVHDSVEARLDEVFGDEGPTSAPSSEAS